MITIDCLTLQPGSNHTGLCVYHIVYYLEDVRASVIESQDLSICLNYIKQFMRMDMGHLKGKILVDGRTVHPSQGETTR